VPAGKKIHFDPSVPEKLNPSDFKFTRSRRHRTTVNGRVIVDYSYNDDYFRFRTDIDYTMGYDGKLKDPVGRSVNDNDYYRYDNEGSDTSENKDTLNIHQQLEQEKKKREESDKKIKELEKKQKETKPSTGAVENSESKEDRAVAKASTPIFSLTQSFF
jgi:hypothetical protein